MSSLDLTAHTGEAEGDGSGGEGSEGEETDDSQVSQGGGFDVSRWVCRLAFALGKVRREIMKAGCRESRRGRALEVVRDNVCSIRRSE